MKARVRRNARKRSEAADRLSGKPGEKSEKCTRNELLPSSAGREPDCVCMCVRVYSSLHQSEWKLVISPQ